MKMKWECKYCGTLFENGKEATEHEKECRERFYNGEFLSEKDKLTVDGYKAFQKNFEFRCEQMISVSKNEKENLGGTIWDEWWGIVDELDCVVPINVLTHIVSWTTEYLLSIIKSDIVDYVYEIAERDKEQTND